MRWSPLPLFLAGALFQGAALAQNDSVSTYKSQGESAPLSPPAKVASAPSPPAPLAESEFPALPDRVAFESAHSYASRRSAGYEFVFDHASMPEVIAALGRIFDAGVTYSGSATREVSGHYSGRSFAEVMLRIVDRTNLHFFPSGTVWSVEEMGQETPDILSLAAVAAAGSSAEPASSGATKDR